MRISDWSSDVCSSDLQKLHGNYRGRITHELSLGEARDEGELQDVATMRSRTSRLSFAARYLAAVRAGGAPLDVWRERRREAASLPPPNRCDDCTIGRASSRERVGQTV